MSVSVQQQQAQASQTPRHQQTTGSSLLACVRESSPLPDPSDDAAFDSYTGTSSAEPSSKKRRFHPLRGLRRMFRRKPRTEAAATAPEVVPLGEAVSGEPAGLLLPGDSQPRSRSASELMGGSQELQAKRRSGGGLSGGSGGGSSVGALGGGLSVSHDSVFTSDGRGGGGSPCGGSALQLPNGELDGCGSGGASASALALAPQPIACHAGVRAELFEAVRRRRRGGRRSEDEDEDLGLPSSPYGGSPTTADVLMERAGIKEAPTKSHSTCSDGSLLSMGSSEMDEDSGHSSKISLHDRASHDPSLGGYFDLEMMGDSIGTPLSHSAARHKMAVRPRRTHGAPRHRRVQQVSSAALPTTPEAIEEFPRNFSPDNNGRREPCLPESADPPTSSEPVFRCRSPPDGTPLPSFLTSRPLPAGLSPTSPEALLASVMLERQLKSASLPPGLALPPAASAVNQEPSVKLSRSQSSSDPAASPPGKPSYRRAISAARIEQAADLANEARSRICAKFGGDSINTELKSPSKEEAPIVKSPHKRPEDIKLDAKSPVKEEKSILKPAAMKHEPMSPRKDEKFVLYKPPQPRKSEHLSPVRNPEDMYMQDTAPIPGPKPEARKVSNAAMRQRVDPGLVSPEPPEEPSPPPWTPPANKVSVSHFVKLPEPEPEVILRHKEAPVPAERRLSVKNKVTDFHALIQDSPSSLDSLETDNIRRLRSLSQSPIDSLEHTELKMSSDSLSSGADMSSTSDDPRPYLKHRRPRRLTPDTSDPDEAKSTGVRKVRGVSRHSDTPFSGKNAVEVASVIRKSVSVDSIRSFSETNDEKTPSHKPQVPRKKSTSNDSISSFENNETEQNVVISKVQNDNAVETPIPRVRPLSRHFPEEPKPVDIPNLTQSSVKHESVKCEVDVTNKSPPTKLENKLSRMSLSTPSVPEFLRVQLNHVDSTTASNVVLSANSEIEPVKRQRIPSAEKKEDESESEISYVRERLLRKSVVEEPKVVEMSEKSQNNNDSTENHASILNRRPSQVKKMELSIKLSENESRPQKVENFSPTEKVSPRTTAAIVKDVEVKPKAESTPEKNVARYSSTFIQPRVSAASAQGNIQPVKPYNGEARTIKTSASESNITIVSRAVPAESKVPENRNSAIFAPKPTAVEKPAMKPSIPATIKTAPAVKPVEVNTTEVVMRRKSVAPESRDEPELFKVFARRSLKLNKDSDSWESQGSTQKSRDSDKENDESEILEKKSTESKSLSSSIVNNNVTSTTMNNNINNNGYQKRTPRTASMPSNNNVNNNNNVEAVNTEVNLRQPSPDKIRQQRPTSLADKMHGVWGSRNIELVSGSNPLRTPTVPLTPAVAAEQAPDKSLTPQVRRRMEEWERLAQKSSRKEALP